MLSAQSPESLKQVGHWQAKLSLGFEKKGDKTIVASRRHSGPYVIQRPFYPEQDGICHIYLLHPPGGMVSGDHLKLELKLEKGAQALLTAPSAGKVYLCPTSAARQTQHFQVKHGALLEWLPQEMILFNGAKASFETHIELQDESSQFIGWELTCLGRRAGKLWFESGCFSQVLTVKRGDQWLLNERLAFDAPADWIQASWGGHGYTVLATAVFALGDLGWLESLRKLISQHRWREQMLAAVTEFRGVLVLRVMGHQAYQVRELLVDAWQMARNMGLSKEAQWPRIWMT